jgi:hypothetical protein
MYEPLMHGGISDEAQRFLYNYIDDFDDDDNMAALNFTDTTDMGFADHPVEYLEQDGYEYIKLNLGAKAKYLKSVTFMLNLCDDEGVPTVSLGEESDLHVDWDEGVFHDNFRGVWGSIDGHLVMMYVTSITEEYILYEVSLKVNGLLYKLTVAYDNKDAAYRMLSARLDESETDGLPSRSEKLLVPGDEVTTVFYAWDAENMELVPFDFETFTIRAASKLEEMTLPDGTYAFYYLMTDYKDDYYYSDWTEVVMKDGESDFVFK